MRSTYKERTFEVGIINVDTSATTECGFRDAKCTCAQKQNIVRIYVANQNEYRARRIY